MLSLDFLGFIGHNLSKVTQLASGRVRAQTQAFCSRSSTNMAVAALYTLHTSTTARKHRCNVRKKGASPETQACTCAHAPTTSAPILKARLILTQVCTSPPSPATCTCAHPHSLSQPSTAGSRSWCLERKLSLKKSLWPALTMTPLSLHPSPACRDVLIPPPPCSPRVSDRLQRSLVPQWVLIQAPGGREPECVVNECGLQPPGSSRQCGKKAWLEPHRLRHCSLSHPIQRAVGLHPGLNFCSAACQLGSLGLVI